MPETKGSTGANGWTPVLAGELDGTRTLIKVLDWAGGEGRSRRPDCILALRATTPVLSGPTRSTVSNITTTNCQVTVQQQAILTGLLSALAGATANVLIVER